METVFRPEPPMPAGMFQYPPYNPVGSAWQQPSSSLSVNWTAILVFVLLAMFAVQLYVTFVQPAATSATATSVEGLAPVAPASSQELIDQGYDP